jgi:hypothetical protein
VKVKTNSAWLTLDKIIIQFGLQMMVQFLAGDYKGDGESFYDLGGTKDLSGLVLEVQQINQIHLAIKF